MVEHEAASDNRADRGDLCGLSAEALRQRARAHVDGFFNELQAATGELKEAWQPAKVIRRHPILAGILAGLAGFSLVRLFRRGPSRRQTDREGAPGAFGRSFLLNLARIAGRVLPELLVLGLIRGGARGAPREKA